MMNVLWRYIDELVGKGLDPGTIIELLCYATINMIPMASAARHAAGGHYDHG